LINELFAATQFKKGPGGTQFIEPMTKSISASAVRQGKRAVKRS